MRDLVSICIPTYSRPDLLRDALASCFAQTYRPLEIIISDDSPDDRTEGFVRELPAEAECEIVYRHNRPRLGQNDNVNALFDLARGERLVLLHDDDLLLPEAVERLRTCWEPYPDLIVAYGRFIVVGADGQPLPRETEATHRRYSQTSENSGLQRSALEAAFYQRMWSDGYMIRSDVARRVRYRDDATAGVFGDTDFAIRVALEHDRDAAFFVDADLSFYRYSLDAVSNSEEAKRRTHPFAGIALYRFVEALEVTGDLEPAKRFQLEQQADKAVKGLATSGQRREALRIFFSRSYPWRKRLTAKGAYHLALIALPGVDRMRGYGKVQRVQAERGR